MAMCEFTFVPCPKECKKSYMKKDMDNHIKKSCPNRVYKCEYCQEKGTYAHITQVHYMYCQPKQRAEILYYQDIAKNLGVIILALALAIILAKFDYNSEALKCESEMNSLKQKESDRVLNLTGLTVFQVTRFQQENNSFSFSKSPSFYTGLGGYHMAIQVNASSGKGPHGIVSVYAVLLKGQHDAELSWPFVGKVAITLLNQLEDNKHKTKITNVTNARVGDKWGFQQFGIHSALAHDTQYLKNDTLYFRVSVEVSDHKPWLECSIM